MTNQKLAEAFAQGENKGQANSMYIKDLKTSTVIYSYGEHFPIAIRTSDMFAYVTNSKYSSTTSKQTTYVKRAMEAEHLQTEEKTCEELKQLVSEISRRNYQEYRKINHLD